MSPCDTAGPVPASLRVAGLALAILSCPVSRATAQTNEVGGFGLEFPDSVDLRSQAEDAQARFERVRRELAPYIWARGDWRCDEMIGRLCLRFGTDGPVEPVWDREEEDEGVDVARRELLGVLDRVGTAIPGDAWVLAQRVLYHGERGDWTRSVRVSRDCGLTEDERWWCRALEGLAQHRLEQFEEAEAAFEKALDSMPGEIREDWTSVSGIVAPDLLDLFDDADRDEGSALEQRLWTLGDPLFLVSGSERLTEHLARHTLARANDEARNPYRMTWADDLAEMVVRYGPVEYYEQERGSGVWSGPDPVIGYFDPRSRHSLPEAEYLLSPSSVPVGAWKPDAAQARTRYRPSYATRIRPLSTQQARFRRGDDLFLVLGWAGAADGIPDSIPRLQPATGLFLMSMDGLDSGGAAVSHGAAISDGAAMRFEGGGEVVPAGFGGIYGGVDRLEGVATARVAAGQYLVSMEAFDRDLAEAWRARHGVELEPLAPGIVELSDLVLLDPAGAFETSVVDHLEAHLERVVRGRAVPRGPVEVAWEVYGLPDEVEALDFVLAARAEGVTPLRRVAEFLRLVDRTGSVEIAWTEGLAEATNPSTVQPPLRRLRVDLSSLPPGPVRLTLTLRTPGRTASVAEVRFDIVESGP